MRIPRSPVRDTFLILSGLAVLCAGVLADSIINSDTSDSADSRLQAVQRIQHVPRQIGLWSSEDETISDRERQVAAVDGYIRRRYRHSQSGRTVTMTLLCGRSGPMSVHPPTACFEGVGYSLASGPAVTPVDCSGTADNQTEFRCELNKASFRQSDTAMPRTIRVFWGWSVSGLWQAPQYPRLTFRDRPYLYKLYVTSQSLAEPGQPSNSSIETFLQDALPVLRTVLSDEQDQANEQQQIVHSGSHTVSH
jgi:hypothetical protein